MQAKLLKVALPWLILALMLPVLALFLAAGPVKGCPCGGGGVPPPVTKTITVDVSSHGTGEVEVARQMPDTYPVVRTAEVGERVRLFASPADGYYFVGWSGNLIGNGNPAYVQINDNAEVVAHFFPEEIASADNRLHLVFPVGTAVRGEYGQMLDDLEIAINETPLPPPPEASVIGLPYELGPHGTTFDRPVNLSFSYDPSQIPDRVAEEGLFLAYYDDEAAQWLELPSVVDVSGHIVTAPVNHLSIFNVIAPEPPPLPAAFTPGELTVSPVEAEIGETVTVSVLVTNSGELEGSYSLTLTINGVVAGTREITMAGGSQQVVFSTAGDEAGDYSVDVNGLEGSFTVLEAPLFPMVLPGAVMWAIVGLAIAALVVSSVIFPVVSMRRDY
ncbi:MAG TPA: hypothetical protein VMW60_01765 [Dehalococcoidales bacterium]|nr:hypothetical protein [Dehalococcoidales bacterium]